MLLEEIDATKGDFVVNFIPEAIIFPTFVDRTYSGLGLQFKITFQAIQNYIPDDDGNQLPNTIENAYKIFDGLEDEDLQSPAPLECFTISVDVEGNVILDIKSGVALPESIVLPKYDEVGRKITTIGDSFASNTTVKHIAVPSTYTAIKESAFENNRTIQTIDLSRTKMTIIANSAFKNSSITKVKLPTTLKQIDQDAFCRSELSSIVLPEGLERIGGRSLSITKLSAIYIPKTVKTISASCPIQSQFLKKIAVDNDNPYFMDVDDQILYNKNQSRLIQITTFTTFTSYEMPSSVTSADAYSLNYARNLTSIIFNNNVITIPLLRYCYSLNWVEFKTTIVPPLSTAEPWLSNSTKNIKVFVPDSSVNAYKTALSEYTSNIYAESQR